MKEQTCKINIKCNSLLDLLFIQPLSPVLSSTTALVKKQQNWLCPTSSEILAVASCAECTINFHNTWSLWPQRQRQCMGTHFISRRVAVRRGKLSWNSWLIASFSEHSTWVEAAASCHMLFWSTVAWSLERNQCALRASCAVEDEEDTGYETVDSPRSPRVLFRYDVALWLKTRVSPPPSSSFANTSKETVRHLAWKLLLHTAESLLLIVRKKKEKRRVCEKHRNQMPQSCCSN